LYGERESPHVVTIISGVVGFLYSNQQQKESHIATITTTTTTTWGGPRWEYERHHNNYVCTPDIGRAMLSNKHPPKGVWVSVG
jgi:hypothetical protein